MHNNKINNTIAEKYELQFNSIQISLHNRATGPYTSCIHLYILQIVICLRDISHNRINNYTKINQMHYLQKRL